MTEKPDYKIEVFFGKTPGEHPVYATITATRYKDTKEFSAKTINSIMRQIAQWINEN